MRGGTILPILRHNKALSLLRCKFNPLRLEIFLDPEDESASGLLYMDDGKSFEYEDKADQEGEKVLLVYTYKNNTLSTMKLIDNSFDQAAMVYIHEVVIYGVSQQPTSVTNLLTGDTTLLFNSKGEKQGSDATSDIPSKPKESFKFRYAWKSRSLRVTGLSLALDLGQQKHKEVEMFKINV